MDEDFIVESKAKGYFSESPAGIKIAEVSFSKQDDLPACLVYSILHSLNKCSMARKGHLLNTRFSQSFRTHRVNSRIVLYAVFFTQQACQLLVMVSAGNNRACLLLPVLCMTFSSPTERFPSNYELTITNYELSITNCELRMVLNCD